MKRNLTVLLAFCLAVLLFAGPITASGLPRKTDQESTAIVVASFGTTVPRALPAIMNIMGEIRAAYPKTEVRLTFTSNIIRSIWRKRQAEAQVWLDKDVPAEILYATNIIATIGDLREDGYKNIIVQPTHMFFMEQSHDLQQYVNALGSIRTMKERWRPFHNLVMGRPALGMPGDRYDYHADIEAVVATLAGDARRAREAGAMLVYMGHGNKHWSTGIYQEVEKQMRQSYPDVETFVGVVEGYPALDDLLPRLERGKTQKLLLKPFMIVAGDHAVNDMAGPEADSWKSVLSSRGYQVEALLEGLGSNDLFAQIFVDHIADAAGERGITLE